METSSTSFALDTDILDAMANLNFNGMDYHQAKKYAFEIMSTVEEVIEFCHENLSYVFTTKQRFIIKNT